MTDRGTVSPSGTPRRHRRAGTVRPWQVPSQVVGRFVIAVTAVVGTTAFGYQAVLLDIPAVHARAVCVSGLSGPGSVDAAGRVDPAAVAGLQACLGTQQQDALLQMLIGLAVLTAAVLLVFLAAPWCTLTLRGLRRVDRTAGLGELAADLRDLVAATGLAHRPPVFVLSRSNRISGATFGHHPVRFIRLDLGTVHARTTEPALFRAVVLHELAHLRNRDVDITGLTIALGWAFPTAVLAPVAMLFLNRMPPAGAAGNAGALMLLTVLVTVSVLSVLRAREYGADARLIGADAAGMADLLARPPGRRTGLGSRLPRWRLLRLHPLAQARIGRLAEPGALLRARAPEALLAGLTVGVAAPAVMDFCGTAAHGHPLGLDPITAGAVLTGLLLGAPAALYLTATVWRSAAGGWHPRGWLLGLSLGAGALAGRLMSWPTLYTDLPAQPVAEVTLALLFLLGFSAAGHWTVRAAHPQPTDPSHATPGLRGRWWLTVAAATLVIMMLLAGWLALQMYLSVAEADLLTLIGTNAGFRSGGNGALRQIVLVGYGLRFWAGHIGEVAPYLSVMAIAALLLPLCRHARLCRDAVGAGIAVGLPAAVLLPFTMLGFATAARDPAIGGRAVTAFFDANTLSPITAAAVVAALVAAVRAERLRALSGLLSALTCGLLAAPAVITSVIVYPCITGTGRPHCLLTPDLEIDAGIVRHALFLAPLLGLLAAAAVTLVATVAHRIPDRSRLQKLTRAGVFACLALLLALSTAVVGLNRLRPAASAVAADRDPCLLGTWRRTAAHLRFTVQPDSRLGNLAELTADAVADLSSGADTGYLTSYRADGSATDFYDRAALTGTVADQPVSTITRGMATYRWSAHDGTYRQLDTIGSGYHQQYRQNTHTLTITAPEPDSVNRYSCTRSLLLIAAAGGDSQEVFTRILP